MIDSHPFTGRVVRKRVKKLGITLDGFVVGRVIRYIDVGRPDPIHIANPDDAMAEEPWEPTKPTALQNQSALQERVVAYLTKQGASRAKEIATAIDKDYAAVCLHLSKNDGTLYCHTGRVGKAVVWGLVGVDSESHDSRNKEKKL